MAGGVLTFLGFDLCEHRPRSAVRRIDPQGGIDLGACLVETCVLRGGNSQGDNALSMWRWRPGDQQSDASGSSAVTELVLSFSITSRFKEHDRQFQRRERIGFGPE